MPKREEYKANITLKIRVKSLTWFHCFGWFWLQLLFLCCLYVDHELVLHWKILLVQCIRRLNNDCPRLLQCTLYNNPQHRPSYQSGLGYLKRVSSAQWWQGSERKKKNAACLKLRHSKNYRQDVQQCARTRNSLDAEVLLNHVAQAAVGHGFFYLIYDSLWMPTALKQL